MANNIVRHFYFHHLPKHLMGVSREVHSLAMHMEESLPNCAEKAAGMRKLLEAKDCFVRARIEQLQDQAGDSGENSQEDQPGRPQIDQPR